jgi:hypothetical protein
MFYDLQNSDDRSKLEGMLRKWLEAARTEYNKMKEEWDTADRYYESDQTPPGFSEAHADFFAQANDPTQPQSTAKQYVVFNKIVSAHEGILGDFIGGKRVITCEGRKPTDRKFARVIRTELMHVQNQNLMWEEVIVPTIDVTIRRGLHWVRVTYDPEVNLPLGKIKVEEVSCRDVMIDPRCRRPFYTDRKFTIFIQRYDTDDANLKFGDYLDGRTLGEDNIYDQNYSSSNTMIGRSTTVYEFEYSQYEYSYFRIGERDDAEEIDKEVYDEMQADPLESQRSFKAKHTKLYKAWFNEGAGVFYNAPADDDLWSLWPAINIKSEGRLYPFGRTKYEMALQDLLNVMVSVLLDTAKKNKDGIVHVDPAAFDNYSDQIEKALKYPGRYALPAATANVFYPKEISQGLVTLFQMISGAIQDVQSQHPLSRGEMPKERLARETVNLLIQQDRKSHGRMDVTLRWTLTMLAKKMYSIIATKYTDSHWAKINESPKSDPDYVPVNFFLNENEYNQLMLEIMGAQPTGQETPEELQIIQQALEAQRRKFESVNEVRKTVQKVYTIKKQKYSEDEVFAILKESHLTMAEFKVKYDPQVEDVPVYAINDITRNPDIDLVYELDFNADTEKDMQANIALNLFDKHVIGADTLVKHLDFPDPETALLDGKRYWQAQSVGEAVVANPQLYQAVMAALQAPSNGQPQKKEKVKA